MFYSWKRLGGLLKALGVFLTVSVLLPKRKIDAQASKIIPKTIPNPPEHFGLEGIVLRIAFGPLFFSDLWASWAVSGASWDHLGAVLGVWQRLGAVLARPRGGLGPSLGRLGASWRILGASWERLGASWKRFGTISTKNFGF